MSYKDDEDFKIGDFNEEEDDLDLDDVGLPLDDDILDDDEPEAIADLDGSEY